MRSPIRRDDVATVFPCLLRRLTVFAICGLMLLSVSCGGGGGQAVAQSISVTLTPSSASVLLGNTQQFTATVTGTSNTGVTWIVNGAAGGSAAVGTINSSGLYSAPQRMPSPTTVTVTATSQADPSKSANTTVTITSDVSVGLATVPSGTNSVQVATTLQLTATVTSAGNPDKSVTWSVNGIANGNSTLGTISSSGTGAVYMAPSSVPTPPTVSIQATSVADTSKAASITLTFASVPVVSVTVSPSPATISIGSTQQFSAVAKDANGNVIPGVIFGWASSSTAVATVDSTGKATSVAAGTVNITATSSGKSGTAVLTVTPQFSKIAISPASLANIIGQQSQFNGTALDANGNPVSGVPLTWTSSNTNTATITSTGLATGAAIGTTNITASAAGITSNAAPLMIVSNGLLFTPDNNSTTASIASGPSGDVDLVWSGPTSNLNSGQGVFFGRSADGGATFNFPGVLPVSDEQGQPAVAVGPSGNIFAAWFSTAVGTSNGLFGNVALSVSTNGGNTFSSPVNATNRVQNIFGTGASTFADPKVAIGQTGNIHVVTTLSRSLSDAFFDILYSRSTDGGATFSGPTVLFNNLSPATAFGPGIAASGSNVYIAWSQGNSSTDIPIFFMRSTDNGSTFSTSLNLGQQEGGCALNCASIGVNGTGVITVVWPAANGIFFARSTDNGASFSPRAQIPNTKFADLSPVLAVDPAGTLYVVFTRIPPQASGIQNDIFLTRSTDGGATWSVPVNTSFTFSDNSTSPGIAVDGNGNINLVWMEFVPQTFPTPKVFYRRAK